MDGMLKDGKLKKTATIFIVECHRLEDTERQV